MFGKEPNPRERRAKLEGKIESLEYRLRVAQQELHEMKVERWAISQEAKDQLAQRIGSIASRGTKAYLRYDELVIERNIGGGGAVKFRCGGKLIATMLVEQTPLENGGDCLVVNDLEGTLKVVLG